MIFLRKKNIFAFLVKYRKCQIWQKLSFWHILAVWQIDIFLTWTENKKMIFSQNNHFLFTEKSILMTRKVSCSNNLNLFWQILLLRPKVKDFETWVF